MNWMKPLTHSALATLFSVAAMAHAGDQKVTALLDESVSIYTQKNDYFVKEKQVARNALTLPTPVLAESDRGYVKVSLQGKEIWLDAADVTLQPPKSLGSAGCLATPQGASAKVARGATEPCQ